ncbi:MAG: phosphoglucomutase/phosphomannomutase family protein [Proteobacteria bacterium]|nr:phosphoglucomutase/phosphomannomutase family protein [Pseudomonadota bacterium]
MKTKTAPIKFGTSGWRAVIARDFTFTRVKVVTQAIADYLKSSGLSRGEVLVGYDTRFLGDRFARAAAEVLAGNRIKSVLSKRDVPTPVIAFSILNRKASGGINITASHNPPEYSGLKFSPDWGGPAEPQVTSEIEKRANLLVRREHFLEMDFDAARKKGLIKEADFSGPYLKALARRIDLDAIRKAKIKVAVDPLFGTSRGYLDEILLRARAEVTLLHSDANPGFGGLQPDPSEHHLGELRGLLARNRKLALGLAADPDADRFGIVDRGGKFIEPNYILALLADYLIRERGARGPVARSVATSHLIDRVAEKYGRKVIETPVGFKYLGRVMLEQGAFLIGEESHGMSIGGHIPDKDGILAGLLVTEMVARTGKTLSRLLKDLYREVGVVLNHRINLVLTPQLEKEIGKKLAGNPGKIAGLKVIERNELDGVKLILEGGSWILARKSGTEPVVRIYLDGRSEKEMRELEKAAHKWILG